MHKPALPVGSCTAVMQLYSLNPQLYVLFFCSQQLLFMLILEIHVEVRLIQSSYSVKLHEI